MQKNIENNHVEDIKNCDEEDVKMMVQESGMSEQNSRWDSITSFIFIKQVIQIDINVKF